MKTIAERPLFEFFLARGGIELPSHTYPLPPPFYKPSLTHNPESASPTGHWDPFRARAQLGDR